MLINKLNKINNLQNNGFTMVKTVIFLQPIVIYTKTSQNPLFTAANAA